MTVHDLPALNASFNGLAMVCLMAGWVAIKKNGNETAHRTCMIAALIFSTLFLSCYTYYHYHVGAMTPFEKQGAIRVAYFVILATHIPLAALLGPFVVAAVLFAWRGRIDLHTRVTKWLWPAWMYVSVTGVLIYVMLYRL